MTESVKLVLYLIGGFFLWGLAGCALSWLFGGMCKVGNPRQKHFCAHGCDFRYCYICNPEARRVKSPITKIT